MLCELSENSWEQSREVLFRELGAELNADVSKNCHTRLETGAPHTQRHRQNLQENRSNGRHGMTTKTTAPSFVAISLRLLLFTTTTPPETLIKT